MNMSFPGDQWTVKAPEAVGLDSHKLTELAASLGGRGCVIKNGCLVHIWGDPSEKTDWFSSAKPVFSTLLFYAIAEGRASGVDARVTTWHPGLRGKDEEITFAHVANMVSGYARPEPPGSAWAYNDYGIQLYQKTLFDGVYGGDPDAVANDATRFGALGLEHGLTFDPVRRRLFASTPDFARVAWFWLNRGRWGDEQLLPRWFFDEFMRPHVRSDLPHTQSCETADYLGIGTFGGDSDHFTQFGAGIYGFNWWFNGTGRLHLDSKTWPDAPPDTVMTIGARGNCAVLIPSLQLVLTSAQGNWGTFQAGDRNAEMNRHIAQLVRVAGDVADPLTEGNT